MSKNKIIIIFGLLLCMSTGYAMNKKRAVEWQCLIVETCDKRELTLRSDLVEKFPTLYDAWNKANQADSKVIPLPTDSKVILLPSITFQTMNTLLKDLDCSFSGNSISLQKKAVRNLYYKPSHVVTAETIESSIDCLNAANYLKNSYLEKSYIKLLVPFFESDKFFEYVESKKTTYAQYLDSRISKDLQRAFALPMQIWEQKKKIECPAKEEICAFVYSSDEKRFVVGCKEKTYVYNETGTLLHQIPKGPLFNNSLAISGNMLAIASAEKTFTLYDLNKQCVVGTTQLNGCVSALAMSPHDNTIWVGLQNAPLQRINPKDMTVTLNVPLSNDSNDSDDSDDSDGSNDSDHLLVGSIACSADGSKVAFWTQGNDNLIHIIDSATGNSLYKLEADRWQTLTFSPDSKSLVAGNDAGMLTFIDPSTGKKNKTLELNNGDLIKSIQFLPGDNTMIAVGYVPGDVDLIDLNADDHRLLSQEGRSGSELRGCAYYAAGQKLAIANSKGGSIASHLSIYERLTNDIRESLQYRSNKRREQRR